LAERLVAYGGKGASVRQLGGDRAGEMRITTWLRPSERTFRFWGLRMLHKSSSYLVGVASLLKIFCPAGV